MSGGIEGVLTNRAPRSTLFWSPFQSVPVVHLRSMESCSSPIRECLRDRASERRALAPGYCSMVSGTSSCSLSSMAVAPSNLQGRLVSISMHNSWILSALSSQPFFEEMEGPDIQNKSRSTLAWSTACLFARKKAAIKLPPGFTSKCLVASQSTSQQALIDGRIHVAPVGIVAACFFHLLTDVCLYL